MYLANRVSTLALLVAIAPPVTSAISIIAIAAPARAQSVTVNTMTDLGTLQADDSGYSTAKAVSANGLVITGVATNDAGDRHAYRWTATGIEDLGSLTPGNTGYSEGTSISADGSVIAGHSYTASGVVHAFRWTSAGMQDLGALSAAGASYGYALSADGTTVVGYSDTATATHAYRWTVGAGMQDLGTLETGNAGNSYGQVVSANGAAVAGYSTTDSGNIHAFHWTSAGMSDVGTLATGNNGTSFAIDISADGNTVVGVADTDSAYHAFRWTSAGIQDLGTIGTGEYSFARSVSADGSVVAGYSDTDATGMQQHAFRWTSAGMQDLGTLASGNAGSSFTSAMNASGSTIVGQADTDAGYSHAFRWTSGGMQDLGTLGGNTSNATGVSSDGSVVVGYSETAVPGQTHAFIWKTKLQDLTNIRSSFIDQANSTAVVLDDQAGRVKSWAQDHCTIADGADYCVRATLGAETGATDAAGRQTYGVALLSFGKAFGPQVTAGGTLALGGMGNSGNSTVASSSMTGIGLWAEYSEGDSKKTGLQASAHLGWGQSDISVRRGVGLSNVQVTVGETTVDTAVVSAKLGYGLERGDWLLTPSMAITHVRTRQDAYVESASALFPASYDRQTVQSTYATLALSGERKISDKNRLRLEAGIEADIAYDKVMLTGTTTLPGSGVLAAGQTLKRNEIRPYIGVDFMRDIDPRHTVSIGATIGSPAYGSTPEVGLRVSYNISF